MAGVDGKRSSERRARRHREQSEAIKTKPKSGSLRFARDDRAP